jgi:mono/diheme cytochrome c family protein
MKYIIFSSAIALIIFNISCKNNSVEALSNGSICDTTAVKYSTAISSMMTNHCTNCHGGSSPQAGLKLESYSDLVTNGRASSSLQRMKNSSNPMPPSGKIDDCNINKLAAWINQGSQNN